MNDLFKNGVFTCECDEWGGDLCCCRMRRGEFPRSCGEIGKAGFLDYYQSKGITCLGELARKMGGVPWVPLKLAEQIYKNSSATSHGCKCQWSMLSDPPKRLGPHPKWTGPKGWGPKGPQR